MKRITAVGLWIVALVSLGLVLWLLTDGLNRDSFVDPQLPAATSNVARELHDAQELQRTPEGGGVSAPIRTAEEPAGIAVDGEESEDRTILFGRVVDENNEPLGGVEARLSGYKEWCKHDEAPLLPGKYKVHGWIQRTDTDGRFRFEVTVPTIGIQQLYLTADRYHSRERRFFGAPRWPDVLALIAGERDAGTIQLARTGAIAGRVLNADGQPLTDVEITNRNDASGLYGYSDPSGSYVVGGVEPGTIAVRASVDGYLNQQLEQIDVAVGQTTYVDDFVLQPAVSLSGRVEDPDGNPLPNIGVDGETRRGGSGARTRTKSDGSFVLSLPVSVPYTCYATLPGDNASDEQQPVYFDPGTTDIVIVLEPDVTTRFHVVDYETDQPIERFGCFITRNAGDQGTGSAGYGGNPPVETHAGGVFEAGARPGLDFIEVFAPDYQRSFRTVEHDDESGTQTIQLFSGPRIRGRIVQDGVGVAGLMVVLTPGRFPKSGPYVASTPALGSEQSARAQELSPRNWYGPRSERAGRTITAADGTFSAGGLKSGEHVVFANAGDRGVLQLWDVIAASKSVDLGDLELTPWARLEGRVVMPPGVSPSGMVLDVDHRWNSKNVDVLDDGSFVIERLSPGPHAIASRAKHGALERSHVFEVNLEPGKTATTLIDLSDYGSTPVTVQLIGADGADFSNWSVAFERRPGLPALPQGGGSRRVNTFNSAGTFTGSVRAIGPARAVLTSSTLARFIPYQEELLLEPGVPVELELRVATGAAEIVFPNSMNWPEHGRLWLEINWESLRIEVQLGEPEPLPPLMWDGKTTLLLPDLLYGEVDLTCKLTDNDRPQVETQQADGGITSQHPVVYEASANATITPGKTTRVELQ